MLGAITATGLPPVFALLALMVGFSGLLIAVRKSGSLISAVIAGWCFGFGYFLAGLYWIGSSFLVDAASYGWLAGPAVVGLAFALAVFPALAACGARVLAMLGIGEVASLAVAWTATEWVRGNVLGGFPWNSIGYVWTVSDQTLQWAAFIGVSGLSLLTVFAAAAPALLWTAAADRERGFGWWQVLMPFALPAALWIGGEMRLEAVPIEEDTGVRVRIVQANIPQVLKWQPAERDRIIQRYVTFSTLGRPPDTKIQIWPETALPVALANDPDWRAVIANSIPDDGILLTGSINFVTSPDGRREPRNSLLAISDSGEILASYDKVRLVPFGEFMPLRWLLPLEKLTNGGSDFVAGPGPTVIAPPGIPPFQPLICYEAIFPGWVPRNSIPEVRWLLNVTNDAWFGRSSGPYQHFEMARTRAVERGLPLVRAANTGISAIVDSYGQVVARLGLGETGALDAMLPSPLAQSTPYGRYGDAIVLALAAGLVALSFLGNRRQIANRKFRRR